MVNNIITVAKSLLLLALIIHIFACIWIGLGHTDGQGWVQNSDDLRSHPDLHLDTYITAIYFIVTTITTVGYGDWLPSTNNEYVYIMFLELLGLAIFSYILGTFQSIEGKESAAQILAKKQKEIYKFLVDVDQANLKVELPIEIFRDTAKYLDLVYKRRVKYIFESENFFQQLLPKSHERLVFECLKSYYIRFRSFFYEPKFNFQAPDKFISD